MMKNRSHRRQNPLVMPAELVVWQSNTKSRCSSKEMSRNWRSSTKTSRKLQWPTCQRKLAHCTTISSRAIRPIKSAAASSISLPTWATASTFRRHRILTRPLRGHLTKISTMQDVGSALWRIKNRRPNQPPDAARIIHRIIIGKVSRVTVWNRAPCSSWRSRRMGDRRRRELRH